MSRGARLLGRMKNNPRDDWQIGDVQRLCDAYEINCIAPSGGGSHFKVSHASQAEILTIPAHKPIKAVYILKLVRFIESVVGSES